MSCFYIPRQVIDVLRAKDLMNPLVCIKLNYEGFEISLALDASGNSGDLSRGDFRVFDKKNQDIDMTGQILLEAGEPEQHTLYGNLDTLIKIKQWCDAYRMSQAIMAISKKDSQ